MGEAVPRCWGPTLGAFRARVGIVCIVLMHALLPWAKEGSSLLSHPDTVAYAVPIILG